MALFYTIGHSTRSLDELVAIFHAERIGLLADVRAIPRSRANPQFNLELLPRELAAHGIAYVHIPELGGRRGRQGGAASSNSFWQNQSFRNYADYAMTEAFQRGFARLQQLGRETPCAVMCAESLWWRCHRRIITDYLLLAGETVVHIVARDKKEVARLTPAARQTADKKIVYVGAADEQGTLL
jgi:uncharacterized protein (DUF488 family)